MQGETQSSIVEIAPKQFCIRSQSHIKRNKSKVNVRLKESPPANKGKLTDGTSAQIQDWQKLYLLITLVKIYLHLVMTDAGFAYPHP